jgi:ribosome-binding factor A
MATRRQEKFARLIKEVVSDAIINHLNDPRIEGFVSVTKVVVSADLRIAEVSLSFFGSDEKAQEKYFHAITHARNRIQAFVASGIKSKFCPTLRFHVDDTLKKTMQTMDLINKAVKQYKKNEPDENDSGNN